MIARFSPSWAARARHWSRACARCGTRGSRPSGRAPRTRHPRALAQTGPLLDERSGAGGALVGDRHGSSVPGSHAGRLRAVTDAPVLDVDLTVHELYREGFPNELFGELRDEHPVWRHPRATLTRVPTASSSGWCSGTPSCSRSPATGRRSARSTAPASRPPTRPARAHPGIEPTRPATPACASSSAPGSRRA